MKIGMTYRLFFSILAATCIALLCVVLIMLWSIERGFHQYLSNLDQGRLEFMTAQIEQAYAEHGSWDFVRANPRLWIGRLLTSHPDDFGAEGMKEPTSRGDAPMHPGTLRSGHRPFSRFVLLDVERKPLFGRPSGDEEVTFRTVTHRGETVGYLGFLPPRHFLNPQQLQFLSRQKLSLVLAGTGMVLVAVIFSLPLANRLVRPIRAMAAATHHVASGKYAVRVPVSSSDELGQLARDFNAMAHTLEKNEKERRQWVADISHELRTPLAVLRGEVEALLDGIRPITPDTIRSLHAEVLRLHRLVDDLYQLSLSDLGALAYRKEDLDLGGVLRDSIDHYRAEFSRKRIALKVLFPEGSKMQVFGDPERLGQLFGNLLDNTLKYTDEGGQLVIRLECRNGQAVADFEDSAPGVPEAEMERLFERLYRLEGVRGRASGGAGLGLAICRNIVEAHDGTISAHQSSLGGVLIRVTLPVTGV
jgi:two-component system sensor histidine kinase BaeS